mgnify:FL=1
MKGLPDFITLSLLFTEFLLKVQTHAVVAVLSGLQVHPCLMHLCECIEVFVLVHGLTGFVDESICLRFELFYLLLKFVVGNHQPIVGVSGLGDSQLKLFTDLFLS